MKKHKQNAYQSFDCKGEKILIINCGSSSVKVSLFNIQKKKIHRLVDAHFSGINSDHSKLTVDSFLGKGKALFSKKMDISAALRQIFEVISYAYDFDFSIVKAVGHRFVHGGSLYTSPTRIDQTVLKKLKKLDSLAPLHNQACITGIEAAQKHMPSIPQIAVFDTGFHHSMPEVASHYALPNTLAKRYQIKKYGFHGIAHAFLWDVYKHHVGKRSKNAKIITLHLGNGCSATAIHNGASIDTSMGFTPAEGLVMGTRAGDIDAAIIPYLCQQEKKSPTAIMHQLNYESGLLGVSGISSDMENLLKAAKTHAKARLAIDMFCYRIVKYLGAYIAVLGGVDAILFSGGIGENAPEIREKILNQIATFGLKLDKKLNDATQKIPSSVIKEISSSSSCTSLFVVGVDENLFIAKSVLSLVSSHF